MINNLQASKSAVLSTVETYLFFFRSPEAGGVQRSEHGYPRHQRGHPGSGEHCGAATRHQSAQPIADKK